MRSGFDEIPVVDLAPLSGSPMDRRSVAQSLGRACRECGFFYVVGHGVDEALFARLEALSRRFFAQPLEKKREIRMERGGRAWRGYFPVGGELTSGRPDLKEGLYFGSELSADDPRVRAGTPLHGPNQFPDLPGFREVVLSTMDALVMLGHRLMAVLASSLDLPESYFLERYTRDPITLFRIFNYPAVPVAPAEARWGVGEHTDYGVLTILRQDENGGLEVRSRARWVDAPPLPGSFVCNLGDMLERMTGGRYRSTPHRVQNRSGRDRLSFPFFFDPSWEARVHPIEGCEMEEVPDDSRERWDGANVHAFDGTYGQYLLSKVSKVFPALGQEVLEPRRREGRRGD
jgi:isopenicillin N synthase-like dioxygenase